MKLEEAERANLVRIHEGEVRYKARKMQSENRKFLQ